MRPIELTRHWIFAAVAGSLVACSLVVDTDGLAGDEAPPIEVPEAGVPLVDATPPTLDDTGPALDAPVGLPDGGPCDDAALCDDFDQSLALDPQWTTQQSNGSVAIATSGFSKPNALSITQNAGGGNAYIEKNITFTRSIHCEFDILIDALPPTKELDYFTTRIDSADYDLYVAHFDNGFVFGEYKGSGLDRKLTLPTPPIGSWFHFVFDTDGSVASVTLAGQKTSMTSVASVTGTARRMKIGCGYAGNTSVAAHALYDNVVCRIGN